MNKNIAPVVEGEWTNWAGANAIRACWSDAPTAVPQYLQYLSSKGVGMTVWTFATDTMISSNNDYASPTTIKSDWSCRNGVLDEGAGSLVQNWYKQQNS